MQQPSVSSQIRLPPSHTRSVRRREASLRMHRHKGMPSHPRTVPDGAEANSAVDRRTADEDRRPLHRACACTSAAMSHPARSESAPWNKTGRPHSAYALIDARITHPWAKHTGPRVALSDAPWLDAANDGRCLLKGARCTSVQTVPSCAPASTPPTAASFHKWRAALRYLQATAPVHPRTVHTAQP
ncbi:hypothetical protein HYPSUDRAFT_207644 [Hypholoma sublateritium FD-334 SS-4]|uniref:Uncharacterized protein n=1 Tax=Hypholoma sublateritium (strain FD-334 SS-4) TaxID=945553 RepID=A0A0D2N9E2_HYPSF|nr:hypothetical protein HYPSUDRAFT_207644 [Hypholoma sublateritium FD-334 SS-4]